MTLHNFETIPASSFGPDNGGADPQAELIISGMVLYGTAFSGGDYGWGTVFRLNTDGSGFTKLHSFTAPDPNIFTNGDGAWPRAGLVLSSNTLYGTVIEGGRAGYGTVFRLNTDGTGFTTLYNFSGTSDGSSPGGLLLSGDQLYGTTISGGASGAGTVFRLSTDGTGFTTLHTFTNSDGANPNGVDPVILSGNTLYGTAAHGGVSAYGTVFRLNTDGSGFKVLHSFSPPAPYPYPDSTNIDGVTPFGGLVLVGDTLYGTASRGGTSSGGTVFKVKTDGSGFVVLHNFTAIVESTNSDGAYPSARLALAGESLYGTTTYGGGGLGTLFSISLPVSQLTITPAGPNVLLTWPTNFTGFTLQSATNLGSPVWSTNLPAPVVVNGQYTVTNPISGTQQFYRLAQ
jgi:uncharacterized repeat protein (TIGR03803 family)